MKITMEQLNQMLYNLTYENGITFGICGNAPDELKQEFCDAINGLVDIDITPEKVELQTSLHKAFGRGLARGFIMARRGNSPTELELYASLFSSVSHEAVKELFEANTLEDIFRHIFLDLEI